MTTLALMVILAVDTADIRRQAAVIEQRVAGQMQAFVLPASACGVTADGVADDTAALQNCINTLPVWATLDGEGRSFAVTQLNLKSRMRMRNFRLVKLAGSANMTSPINLDGRTVAQSNVVLEAIVIEGRRQLETGMITPSAEDGGRHCFRIVGRVSDVVIRSVTGNHCATDGLQLGGHHAVYSDVAEELPLQNIVIRNATFNFNRRVGVAFEGGHNLFFLDVRASGNGSTIGGPADRTSGAHCAHVDGYCFGTGVWTENDHDAAGGSFDSVYFLNLTATQNEVRSFYAFSQSGPQVAGFRAKRNLVIADSTLDAGVRPIAGNPMALQFGGVAADGTGAVYRDVTVQNSTIRGTIGARSLDGLTLSDSRLTGPFPGFLEYFDNVEVRGGERSGEFASSLWLRPDGSRGAMVRYVAGH